MFMKIEIEVFEENWMFTQKKSYSEFENIFKSTV